MPSKLDDLIGQTAIKDFIRAKIQFARLNSVAFPHLLLCGEKESGKKRFAGAIAGELGVQFTAAEADNLTKPLDLNGLLTNLAARQLLAIADIETLRQPLLDILVQAVADFHVDIVIGAGPGARTHSIALPNFSFVGITSKPWLVDERLRRWCIPCEFSPYTSDEAAQIVMQIAAEKGLLLAPEAACDLATYCAFRPGAAATLLQRIANHFQFAPSERIDSARLREITEYFGSGSIYPQSLSLAERLQKMTGVDFEHWVADLFRQAGYRVELTQVTGDHGVDLWAYRSSEVVAIQCKRWDGTVGEPVIRDLYGAMTATNAKAGCLVTTARFTPQAQQFAQNKALGLIDLDKLIESAKSPELLREIVKIK